MTYNDPTGFIGHAQAMPDAARARNAGLSVDAQNQIASLGWDGFWAGVSAALAYQKAGVKPSPPAPPRAPAPASQPSKVAQAQCHVV